MPTSMERAVGRPQRQAAQGRMPGMLRARCLALRPGKRSFAAAATGVMASVMLVALPTSAQAAPSPNGFTPVTQRLLDTRNGTGGVPIGQVQGFTQITLPASVPAGDTAVLTVTATGSAGSGYVQIYPNGSPPPGSRRSSRPDRPSSTTPAADNHCAFLSYEWT